MKKYKLKIHQTILKLCLFWSVFTVAQNNSIAIKADFNPEKDEMKIQQEIVFFNNSDAILNHIYLHNWANSFRDRKTPLSKRLIKDLKKIYTSQNLMKLVTQPSKT